MSLRGKESRREEREIHCAHYARTYKIQQVLFFFIECASAETGLKFCTSS